VFIKDKNSSIKDDEKIDAIDIIVIFDLVPYL